MNGSRSIGIVAVRGARIEFERCSDGVELVGVFVPATAGQIEAILKLYAAAIVGDRRPQFSIAIADHAGEEASGPHRRETFGEREQRDIAWHSVESSSSRADGSKQDGWPATDRKSAEELIPGLPAFPEKTWFGVEESE